MFNECYAKIMLLMLYCPCLNRFKHEGVRTYEVALITIVLKT